MTANVSYIIKTKHVNDILSHLPLKLVEATKKLNTNKILKLIN